MSRLLTCLLVLGLFTPSLCVADSKPKSLPEKVEHGDGPDTFPAECARRIEAGKALLDSGDLKGALREFAMAERADASEPMSYFYSAVIAYRQGDYPLALHMAKVGRDAADENLHRADSPGEPLKQTAQRLKELYDTIEAKAESNPKQGNAIALLRAADEAYASGLLAKAAAAYAEAVRADPTRGDVGLKAATLFADRLKNPLEAARLWQQVLASGEPHATTARAELQSRRDTLESVLQAGLAQRDQWRSRLDATEPLRLAEAFPESADLQIELALLFARKGPVETMIKHLQAASRLGLSADDFLAREEFADYLQQAGGVESAGGKPLASFVRDAYGEEALTAIRTELKRRADEVTRLARDKAEQARQAAENERQARIAAERQTLTAWRDGQRLKVVEEANRILSARNHIEVDLAEIRPDKKKPTRVTSVRSTRFSFEHGKYWFFFTRSSDSHHRALLPAVAEERVSISSFAPLIQIDVWPSSWEFFASRMRPDDSPAYRLPANPTYRTLAKTVDISLGRAANVHSDFSSGGQAGYSTDFGIVAISALLEDQEVARLKALFGILAKLDALGTDVEKLRQLRSAW